LYSFQDGKALTALVHSLKPNFDYKKIDFSDPVQAISDAISMAELNLNIPPLVEAEDVAKQPEELSMMTYISYFRQYQQEHPVSFI
jgi:filamin